MTNLSELLRDINYNPHLLTNLDWREETDWFNKERIEQIISGIYGDEACDIVGEYIAKAWYEACEGDEYDKINPERSLMESSWADTYVFRFNNSESKANLPGSIESYIDEMKAKRSRSIKRKEQHGRLDNKVKQLNVEFSQSSQEEAEAYMRKLPYEMCESLMITIENRNKEIAELRSELKNFKDKYDNSARLLDWYRNREKETIKNVRADIVRTLVGQLIIYAENERQGAARHIRHAIKDMKVNGYPVEIALTEEWKQRLENIGKKKQRRSRSSEGFNFNNPVGTVVAHADTVILKSDKHE